MKRCTHCLLTESYPDLSFDSQGVCSICRNPPQAPYQVAGIQKLEALVEKYKKPSGYECLVAFSGGRDSSFALHYVVNKLNLRPLVVTFDNGFMPQQTRANISNCVEQLKVDHKFISSDQTKTAVGLFLRSWAKLPDPAMISFLCTGCATGLNRALNDTAKEYELKLLINGGGEPERSFAEPMLRKGQPILGKKYSLAYGAFIRLIKNPRYLLHPKLISFFAMEAYSRFFQKQSKDIKIVSLFHYLPWDESLIENTIRAELNWKKADHFSTSWRSDCDIHLIKQYFYLALMGFTKNDEILSNLVRSGTLSRDEALLRLGDENKLSMDFIQQFLKEHGVEGGKLEGSISRWLAAHP